MDCLVIGVGVFGQSVAKSLKEQGHTVICIDKNPDQIEEIKSSVDEIIEADTKLVSNLSSLGVESFDICFVCIGEDLASSIITTLHLIYLGARKVIARSVSEEQGRILKQIGAMRVVSPEIEAGKSLVADLTNNLEKITTIRGDIAMVSITVPKKMVGKKVIEVDLRNQYRLNILWIERSIAFINDSGEEQVKVEYDEWISPDYIFSPFDKVTLLGKNEYIEDFFNQME